MKVVVDAFPLRVGSAGIGAYTLELLGALTREAPGHDYFLADLGPRLSAAQLRSGSGAAACEAQIRELVARVPLAWKAMPGALRRSLIRVHAARLRADIYFGTNFFGAFHPSFRTVITIHDLSHIHYPHDTYPMMYRKLTRALSRDAAQAHAIVAVSECTKRDVVSRLGVPAAKVHVAHNGVSGLFRPVTEPALLADCRRRYALPEHFFLHVGTLEPRKNVPRLLEAFRLLTEAPSFRHCLVLVGGRGWRDRSIRHALASFPRRDRIVLTGWVDREDLPALFSLADVFVYPSLYEGFGLPVLEAMACGTPVITSNASALPEVAGDAALLVDPNSTQEIASAMRRLVEDVGAAASLRQKGFLRARAFPWAASARRVLHVFEEVLER